MEIEEWKIIEESKPYAVSNFERVKYGNTFLRPYQPADGYLVVSRCRNGEQTPVKIHVWVATAFVPNPNNRPMVNHIDGNRDNPYYKNLEWVNNLENSNKQVKPCENRNIKNIQRKVNQMDMKTCQILKTWDSQTEAAIALQISGIHKCCKGNTNSCGGFKWMYVDEEEPEKLEGEEWLDVVYKEKKYTISSFGRIRLLNGKFTHGSLHHDYYRFNDEQVHIVVATAFLPNPNHLPSVNHMDGVTENNRADNLQWCTEQENSQHAVDTGLTTIYKRA